MSSRREDGSWAAQQARQAARRPLLLATPQPTVQSAQSRPTSARPATPTRSAEAPYNGPRPTVYERILKDDIL